MADGRSFTESLVGMLGTPKEPFGLEALLALALLTAAGAAWFALEYGIGSLVARLLRGRAPENEVDEPPPER